MSGISVKDEHLANKKVIFLTLLVFHCPILGKYYNEEHP